MMPKSFDRLRSYIYPRAMSFQERDNMRASNAILGMLGVMLGILLLAQVVMLIAGR